MKRREHEMAERERAMRERLRGPESSGVDDPAGTPALEKERHYTVQALADLWGLSANTVRNIFRDYPGVLKIKSPGLLRKKRKHVTLRIPESIAAQVHRAMRG